MKKSDEKMWNVLHWRLLQIEITIFVIVGILAIIFVLGDAAGYINLKGAADNFIYDQKAQKIIDKPNIFALIKYNLETKRYIFIPKKIELVETEMNVAYRARFQMPNDEKVIQSYLAMPDNNKIQEDLTRTINSCLQMMTRDANLSVKNYPQMVIRALSIYNMDELCAIANNHGYQWEGKFELIQCNEPLNKGHQNDCLNAARFAHYE